MNEVAVRNWIAKAESDLKIGKDEIKTEKPATDAVCFHMQQCVEKYLKAYIIYCGREFRKTHDIAELIELCAEIDLEFKELQKTGAIELTDYAVEIRYGEEFYFPTLDEAKEAVEICEKVKEFVVSKLKAKG
ncbi:MAG: HEPN domain-containing protein, partial [candidate division WOR-3 bacterium]